MSAVRIPSDVDRDDRLLAGLTGRQLLVLGAGGLVLLAAWSVAGKHVALPAFAFGAAPVAAVTLALAFGNVAGLTGDRAALYALRFLRSDKRLVLAPEGVPALPDWLPRADAPGAMPFPVDGFDDEGIVNLGVDGSALLCRASSLNFALRTGDEQARLVAALGQWLNSLSAPVQIVVRAEPVDLDDKIATLRAGAGALPHPELEDAALGHASFLSELAARHDVFRRVVLLVFRAAAGPDAPRTLRRMAEDATAALASAGISLRVLAGHEAAAVVSGAPTGDADRRLLPGATFVGGAA